jgi:hypothetical protein
MTRSASRPSAVLIAILIAAAWVAPVAAWSNGPSKDGVVGNGYGTHDWIIDQALKTFGGKVPAWFDASAARLASDDPDTLFWRTNEHVYMEAGYGRGAVHQVVELYDKAVTHLRMGDAKLASKDIGLLSHFYADVLNPFHTAYAAAGKHGPHEKYELLVDSRTKSASSMPEWQTKDRSPENVTNIRTKTIAAAAYSRGKFAELYKEFTKDQSVLNTRVRQLTGHVLTRASRELGDIIHSVGKGIGNAPAVTRIVAWPKYSTITAKNNYQAIYVKATDSSGRIVQGLQVDVTFHTSADVKAPASWDSDVMRVYTLPDGVAKATAYVDLSSKGVPQKVYVKVTTRGRTLTTTTTYTPR